MIFVGQMGWKERRGDHLQSWGERSRQEAPGVWLGHYQEEQTVGAEDEAKLGLCSHSYHILTSLNKHQDAWFYEQEKTKNRGLPFLQQTADTLSHHKLCHSGCKTKPNNPAQPEG